jgi:hypothetical protein
MFEAVHRSMGNLAMNSDTSTAPMPVMPPVPPAKSLDELIAEQGVGPLDRFEDLFGAGRDWWTDEEFDAHLEHLRAARREKD